MPNASPPSVMSGRGFYNQHSRTQASATAYALPYLETAARQVALPAEGGDFHAVDFGSATGANSLGPLRLALGILRERQTRPFPIRVTHTDQAGNDFSALFLLLQRDPNSYLNGLGEVYPYATGRSFFGPLFPERSIDLGWSSIAVHWMSRIPVPLKDHIWSTFAVGDVQTSFAAQAQQDWEDFLQCRARELKACAPLVLIAGAADERGLSGGEPLLDAANGLLQAMVAEGRLTKEEYEAFTIPIYSRRIDEFLVPFQQGAFNRLYQVVDHRLDFSPDAQCAQYRIDGDRDKFADNLTGFLRAFTEPLLLGALRDSRGTEEKMALSGEFYLRFRETAAKNPDSLQFGWQVFSMHLKRRS